MGSIHYIGTSCAKRRFPFDDWRSGIAKTIGNVTLSLHSGRPTSIEENIMDYQTVNLALNLAGRPLNPFGTLAECNPGGSTICWTPTKGCGTGAMTCVGTSTKKEGLDVQISLPPDGLEKLQKELQELIGRYVK